MQRAGVRPVVAMNTVAIVTVSYNSWSKNIYFRTMSDAMAYLNSDKFISELRREFYYDEGKLMSAKGILHNGEYDADYKIGFISRMHYDYEFCAEDECVALAKPAIYKTHNIVHVHAKNAPILGDYSDNVYVVTAADCDGQGNDVIRYFGNKDMANLYAVSADVVADIISANIEYHAIGKLWYGQLLLQKGEDKMSQYVFEIRTDKVNVR